MISDLDILARFKALQDGICSRLEDLDQEGKFREDVWQMESGGGGRTRIIEGRHIEKGGVNFSAVKGPVSDSLKKIIKREGANFFATGVSIVLHPANPHVPIIHMNVRYFEIDTQSWWFGGGIDLTPHYIDIAQARKFHMGLKVVCDRAHLSYYPRFKAWADDYFYLKHRAETRGVGGIFFDRLSSGEPLDKDQLFAFVVDVGQSFIPIYTGVFQDNFERTYDTREKEWQLYRRGRYAEFNLVWDRGTRFGLETGGRTESILMSLPPSCIWEYNREWQEGSPEYRTQKLLRKGVNWIAPITI